MEARAAMKTMKDGTDVADDASARTCRYLDNPFPECYCMNISSTKISKILMYCARDYESCQIYRTRSVTNE